MAIAAETLGFSKVKAWRCRSSEPLPWVASLREMPTASLWHVLQCGSNSILNQVYTFQRAALQCQGFGGFLR